MNVKTKITFLDQRLGRVEEYIEKLKEWKIINRMDTLNHAEIPDLKKTNSEIKENINLILNHLEIEIHRGKGVGRENTPHLQKIDNTPTHSQQLLPGTNNEDAPIFKLNTIIPKHEWGQMTSTANATPFVDIIEMFDHLYNLTNEYITCKHPQIKPMPKNAWDHMRDSALCFKSGEEYLMNMYDVVNRFLVLPVKGEDCPHCGGRGGIPICRDVLHTLLPCDECKPKEIEGSDAPHTIWQMLAKDPAPINNNDQTIIMWLDELMSAVRRGEVKGPPSRVYEVLCNLIHPRDSVEECQNCKDRSEDGLAGEDICEHKNAEFIKVTDFGLMPICSDCGHSFADRRKV